MNNKLLSIVLINSFIFIAVIILPLTSYSAGDGTPSSNPTMRAALQTAYYLETLRTQTYSAFSKKAASDMLITESLKTIFAVAENYPTLKANENFLKLQNRITSLENELADRREFYNDSVNIYNIRIQSIPDLIVARMMKCTDEPLFKASEEDKAIVHVSMRK